MHKGTSETLLKKERVGLQTVLFFHEKIEAGAMEQSLVFYWELLL